MLIRLKDKSYTTNHSVIIAGPTASGKTHLINRLEQSLIDAPLVHREITEETKYIPASSVIHWPTAEKFPQEMDFSNAGAVLLLGVEWTSYCANVEGRQHHTQYSQVGLKVTYDNWYKFFMAQKLPIVTIPKNDIALNDIISELLVAMKLIILY